MDADALAWLLDQHSSTSAARGGHLHPPRTTCACRARRDERLVAEDVARASSARSGIYDVCVTGGAVVAEYRGHSRTEGKKFQIAED